MRESILSIVLAILAFSSLSVQAAQTGSIVGWGIQVVGVDTSAGFTTIAAGTFHSLGLKDDGSVVAWGYNKYGQCDVPAPNRGFVAIVAGESHSLGMKVCLHKPIGDFDDNCKVDLADLALICDQWLTTYFLGVVVDTALNWLIDCDEDPSNPACVPVQ